MTVERVDRLHSWRVHAPRTLGEECTMDLVGWDVVLTCDRATCNAIIAEELKNRAPAISYTEDALQVTATFSEWSIVDGGSNKLLWLKMTIAEGTVCGIGDSPVDLSGVEVIVEVQLGFATDIRLPNQVNLQFNLRVEGQQLGDETDGAVTVHSVTDAKHSIASSGGKVAGDVTRCLQDCLAKCLIEHQEQLALVLSCLDQTATESNWMVLKRYKYACLPGQLAILGVVWDRDISALQVLVAPEMMTGSGQVRLAISDSLFLGFVLYPMLNYGIRRSEFFNPQFDFEEGSRSISSRGFDLGSYQGFLQNVEFQMDFINVTVNEDQIVFDAQGSASTGQMTFTMKLTNGLSFDTSHGTLHLTSSGDPSVQVNGSISPFDALGCLTGIVKQQLNASLDADAMQIAATTMPISISFPGMSNKTILSVELIQSLLLRFDIGTASAPLAPLMDSGDASWIENHPFNPVPFISPGGGFGR